MKCDYCGWTPKLMGFHRSMRRENATGKTICFDCEFDRTYKRFTYDTNKKMHEPKVSAT
jgi:hypothetical protein